MSKRRACAYLIIFLAIPGVVGFHGPYNRVDCLRQLNYTLDSDNSFVSRNPHYFFRGSTIDNPLLTLQGCNALCGSDWGPYPDNGPRLMEWIIPGVLLIANVHFAPIGWKRYLMVAHMLGDPIDSMWRLVSTVEDWNESSRISSNFIRAQKRLSDAKRQNGEDVKLYDIPSNRIAVILSAAARLVENLDKHESSKQLFDSLDIGKVSEPGLDSRYNMLHRTATALRDQRIHDIRRSGFAILLYIIQVVGVFVRSLGGLTSPSGGKVSPAMMLVWLLPEVLLSNGIGDYGCWRLSKHTLFEFPDFVGIDPRKAPVANRSKSLEARRNARSILSVSELECSGMVLHTRPSSVHELECPVCSDAFVNSGKARKTGLAFISALPIIMACAAAFAADETAPTYFSCRAISITSSLVLWLLSTAATYFMRKLMGRRQWLYILLKDIIVATPILTIILLSSCGFFNSCYCSGGAVVRGRHAQVVMNPVAFYSLNNNVIYPAAVAVALGLQILVPVLLRRIQLQGFKTMWWNDTENPPTVTERSYAAPIASDCVQIDKVKAKRKVRVQVDETEMDERTQSQSTHRSS